MAHCRVCGADTGFHGKKGTRWYAGEIRGLTEGIWDRWRFYITICKSGECLATVREMATEAKNMPGGRQYLDRELLPASYASPALKRKFYGEVFTDA